MSTADATDRTLRSRSVPRAALSEKWRRRLPLLPALIFTIVLTQVPFVMSIWYSLTDWKVVPAGAPELRRAGELRGHAR